MARTTRNRPPFRTELPATRIVREHARTGVDPAALAPALYGEAVRRLDGGPEPEAPDAVSMLARNALALYPVSLDESAAGALTPEWLEEFHRLSRPDADHRRHGRWYTARPIARYMARRALSVVADRPDGVTALDPACGCGALVTPLFEAVVRRRLEREPDRPAGEIVRETLARFTVADVDGRAVETAVRRLRYAARRLAGAPVGSSPRTFVGNTLTHPPEDLVTGGVDIVVMNPPYLGNRYFEALPDPGAARAALRQAFGWNDDLYTHFLERAWEWLRPGGALCAITSDTFLTIPSKSRTRATLRRHDLREIARVPSSAFAAHVNTCVTLATRRPPEPDDRFTYLDARAAPESAWDALEDVPPPVGVDRFVAPASVYARPDHPFYRPTPRAIALFERYLAGPDEVDGRRLLPLGCVAPARDCGINSGNVRHRLFFADAAEGRRRLIQGRQLERYRVRWDSPAARYRWVDIGYRPDPTVRGVGRGGRPSAHGETWGYRGETSVFLEPERLFLRQTEDDLFAAYLRQDPADPVYTDNTLFTIVLNNVGIGEGLTYHYLLGLLNSAFLNELYHAFSQEKGRAQAQVKVGWVNRLPIAVPTDGERAEVEGWTRRAIEEVEAGRPVGAIQWQLDALVGSLYGAEGLPP